jgi:hypothetical protein
MSNEERAEDNTSACDDSVVPNNKYLISVDGYLALVGDAPLKEVVNVFAEYEGGLGTWIPLETMCDELPEYETNTVYEVLTFLRRTGFVDEDSGGFVSIEDTEENRRMMEQFTDGAEDRQ